MLYFSWHLIFDILFSQIFEDKLIAASESGKIYICRLSDGKFVQIFSLQTPVPITSMLVIKEGFCATNLYIGTFRDYLQVHSFDSYQFLKSIYVEATVACMDNRWGFIFIGCQEGWLQRYSIEVSNLPINSRLFWFDA